MSNTQAIQLPREDDIDAQIGRRAHQLLWDRKITQTVLGQAIDVDASSVTKLLRGSLGWKAPRLIATARALDTTVAYLIGETTNPDVPTSPVGLGGVEPPHTTVKSPQFAEVIPIRQLVA